jgi:serine/threonine-protein kinase
MGANANPVAEGTIKGNPPKEATGPGQKATALYLQARSYLSERTPASLRKAIRLLEKAVILEGSFALACAALADCYSILMEYGVLSPREGLTAARLASGRALNHAPELAEALTSAALVRQMALDWKAAETEFKAAIAAHPGYGMARQRFALLLSWIGRWEESRRQMKTALALGRHSPVITASAAWIEYYQGSFQEGARAARTALSRHPGFTSAEIAFALSLVHLDRAAEGATVLETSRARDPENVSVLSLLSYARAREGKTDAAETLLRELRERADSRYVSPYYLAVPLQGLGREVEALGALADAEAEGSPQLVYLATEPIFSPLRARPELQALLERTGLPHRNGKEGEAG